MYPVEFRTVSFQKVTEAVFVCLFGGVIYYGIEVIWKGTSHWSMALCGALCFWFLYRMNRLHFRLPLPLRALAGTLFITAVELIAGCILNVGLGWDIWNYSELPLNFLGQICLPFSVLWFLLCFPCAFISYLIRRVVFLADE
ncbi:MAG: hypothetical protein IJF33_01225 [Clostridia bacterium]|nr:hypothetical protein [Clostridia bacterium]